jgi:hypothetical protein
LKSAVRLIINYQVGAISVDLLVPRSFGLEVSELFFRIAKQLKPDIDFLKVWLSGAFRKSVLDFIEFRVLSVTVWKFSSCPPH